MFNHDLRIVFESVLTILTDILSFGQLLELHLMLANICIPLFLHFYEAQNINLNIYISATLTFYIDIFSCKYCALYLP